MARRGSALNRLGSVSGAASRGKMELIVARARMGEIGSITVGRDMATNRFWDLEQTDEIDF